MVNNETRLFQFFVLFFNSFLDASSHLFRRGCLSVRPSVRRSVGRSVMRIFQIPKMRNYVEKVERTHLLVDQTCFIAGRIDKAPFSSSLFPPHHSFLLVAPCFLLALSYSLLPQVETINSLISVVLTKALLITNGPTDQPTGKHSFRDADAS